MPVLEVRKIGLNAIINIRKMHPMGAFNYVQTIYRLFKITQNYCIYNASAFLDNSNFNLNSCIISSHMQACYFSR